MTLPSAPGRVAAAVAAGILSVLVLFVYLPTLAQGWAPLDDDFNFLANPHFRGFSGENLRWMWTARLGGHYIPLSWMSLTADFELSGMAPRRYYRTDRAPFTVDQLRDCLGHVFSPLGFYCFARVIAVLLGFVD